MEEPNVEADGADQRAEGAAVEPDAQSSAVASSAASAMGGAASEARVGEQMADGDESEYAEGKEEEDEEDEIEEDEIEEDDGGGREQDAVEAVVSGASAWFFGTLSSIVPPTAARNATRGESERSVDNSARVVDEERTLLSAANRVGADVSTGLSSLGTFVDSALEDGSAVDTQLSAWFESMKTSAARSLDEDGAPEDKRMNLRELFGELDASTGRDKLDAMAREAVLDSFECELVQKYRCYHNSITPERVFSHAGTLFVTESHLAFAERAQHATPSLASFLQLGSPSDESGTGKANAPIRVLHSIESVQKIQTNASGGSAEQHSLLLLRVVLHDKSSVIFGRFSSATAYNEASSLLKHIKESIASTTAAHTSAAAPSTVKASTS